MRGGLRQGRGYWDSEGLAAEAASLLSMAADVASDDALEEVAPLPVVLSSGSSGSITGKLYGVIRISSPNSG